MGNGTGIVPVSVRGPYRGTSVSRAPLPPFAQRTKPGEPACVCVTRSPRTNGPMACPIRPVVFIEAVCEHGHRRDGWHCSRHLSAFGQTRRAAKCLPCREGEPNGRGPHDCVLRIVEIKARPGSSA